MNKEIEELKGIIEHHKGMKYIWQRKCEFLIDFIKENFGLTDDQIDYAWNQYVIKHWDDEREKIHKENVIRLFPPADGKGD